jgi:hypothetical protein
MVDLTQSPLELDVSIPETLPMISDPYTPSPANSVYPLSPRDGHIDVRRQGDDT